MEKHSAHIVESKTPWNQNVFFWIIGSLFAPITIPYILFQAFCRLKAKMCEQALADKVVLITGASSGLGESLAHVFYNAGCRLLLVSRRIEELERVRRDLMEIHPQKVRTHPPVVKVLDLSDIENLETKVNDLIKVHGHIDILINNAGVSTRSDVLSTSLDVAVKVMAINYFGAVALTKAVAPSMVSRREGTLVFVSSVQGKIALPHRSAYSASKHALQAFSDSLRAELSEHNINVLIVSPGYIKTSLSLNAMTGNGEAYGKMDKATEEGANPDDVARDILKSVIRGDKDVVMAPLDPKIGIALRYICPGLYFWLMARRASKLNAAQ